MATGGVAETSSYITSSIRPRPFSPEVLSNYSDTGRESRRTKTSNKFLAVVPLSENGNVDILPL